MTWGVESNVVERFGKAGIPEEDISFARQAYTFNYPGPPSEFVDTFRRYYGPTMNAFDAAQKDGKSEELRRELEALFEAQNKRQAAGATSIPATFLRVTVQVK